MFRRMIFPVLLGLVGCGILVGLGVWQMQRLAWKEALLTAIDARIHDAPGALPVAEEVAKNRYAPVTVTGEYTGQVAEVLFSNRDQRPGVIVIAAFETAEGRKILVQRGFVLEEARRADWPVEPATVTGNLDLPNEVDGSTPPQDQKTGLWFARDIPGIAASLGTEATFLVASGPEPDGIAPMPIDTSSIPNNHRQYAITWFSLALVWAGMTVFWLWRIRQRQV